MNNRVFSVILLPTAECNVACTYCFEHKEPHRLSMLMVPLLSKQLLDHLEHEGIAECEIYWQGGEAMIMGPAWFVEAGEIMDQAAAGRGRRFVHYFARAEFHARALLRRGSPAVPHPSLS